MRKRSFALPLGLGLLAASLGCMNLPQAYCEVGGDCDRSLIEAPLDPVPGSSDDSVPVCAVHEETRLSSLRANSEAICREVADAWELYMVCVVEEGNCDPFRLSEPECKDELEEWLDLADEAGDRCRE